LIDGAVVAAGDEGCVAARWDGEEAEGGLGAVADGRG